jgi:hypothetical protein
MTALPPATLRTMTNNEAVLPPLPKTQNAALSDGDFGSAAEYRYGDSNPGFRTENPAS